MKNLKLTNILPIALGFALGYVAYKMVAKMIGDQDEVEPMLSARGSFFGTNQNKIKSAVTKQEWCCYEDGTSGWSTAGCTRNYNNSPATDCITHRQTR